MVRSEVSARKTAKYLGVMIDGRLKFKAHPNVTTSTTANASIALTRSIVNARGQRKKRSFS